MIRVGLRRLAGAWLLVVSAAVATHAGPWAAGRGRLYAKIAHGHLSSSELAFPDGTVFEIPEFRRDEADLYLYYGLSEHSSLLVDVPLRSSDLDDDPDELKRETGFGDLKAGVQHQLWTRGRWVAAVRGVIQAPTGDVERAEGLQPTGSGVWEGEAVLGVGASIHGGRLYAFAEAGYGLRGGGLRDGLVYGMQLGWNATGRLVLAANAYGVEPWSHEAPNEARGSPVGLGDRVTYVKYGPTAIVKIGSGWGLQLDVEGLARARNLARGVTYRAGVFLSR